MKSCTNLGTVSLILPNPTREQMDCIIYRPARFLALFLPVLALAFSPVASAEEKKPVNLLRLPAAKIEKANVSAEELTKLQALADNDPATVVQVKGQAGAVDVVYGFGGAVVAPERLVVRLPGEVPAGAGTDRVEVLVSTLSAQAGFFSLRSDPLKSTAEAQEFSFPPTGARWIMLRFTAAEKARFVAVAGVAVLGYEGPPVSHYAFKDAPAKAFDVLARLKKSSSLNVEISADESALFADVKDGKFTKWSFDAAALLASGVIDANKRKEYLKQLDALEAGAKKAVAAAKTPFEKGEKLLAWLHHEDGPLAKGYEANQTDLSAILDTGTFNCVSSAVLYNILGRRLGLDVRAIEVPDHAFAILYDGTKHADVETTTSSGFNPARDEAAQEQFAKQTGFRYIPDSHREERREIGEAGLVAIICYNHGVTLAHEKRYHEALLADFRAMSLDREFASAVKNALAALGNWSNELSQGGKYESALNVLLTGVDLAPKDATLLHNRKVVWGHWAETTAKAGQYDEALAILRRAATAVPDGNFPAMQAWIYLRPGEEFAEAGEWEKALAVVEPGLKKVDQEALKELREWSAGVPLRWSQAEMDKKNFAKAIDVLHGARSQQPKDDRLTQNLVYGVQEWARETEAKEGNAKAKAILLAQMKRFPQIAGLKEVASGYAHRVIGTLRGAGKFPEALAAIGDTKELLKDKDESKTLAYSVYDAWAASLKEKKDWQGAANLYAKGLGQYPKDKHLSNNAVATWDTWAATFIDMKDWAGAIKVYEKALKQFPDDGTLKNNRDYCKEEMKKK
ncbi:MAG: transglutaminase family protein [Gemmataceae bacterium]